ncbi:hypothetical protein AVEN_269226-1 [Araneus ventricosus]|uniref:Uncharacterized protein n=1 Tax=Araneus ventricosus TaxID=182803 RepID=A0A4Y2PIZ5_ARAVE|nr:hypothetical protein AVEN_269226-1 [Araneus ventricosus]
MQASCHPFYKRNGRNYVMAADSSPAKDLSVNENPEVRETTDSFTAVQRIAARIAYIHLMPAFLTLSKSRAVSLPNQSPAPRSLCTITTLPEFIEPGSEKLLSIPSSKHSLSFATYRRLQQLAKYYIIISGIEVCIMNCMYHIVA